MLPNLITFHSICMCVWNACKTRHACPNAVCSCLILHADDHKLMLFNCIFLIVPNVDLTLWDDNVMEASWMNTLFSSNVTYCVNFNGFPDQHKTLPVCPNKKICENTGKKSLQKCEIARHVPFDATVFVISSIHVPGCPMKRVNISLKVTAQGMYMCTFLS